MADEKKTGGRYRELPTATQLTIEYVWQVRSALNALMNGGSFMAVANLVDNMWADARCSTAFDARATGLFAAELELGDKQDNRKKRKVSDSLKETWETILPQDQRNQLFVNGVCLGASPGTLEWQKGELWVPRLTAWNCRHLQWQWQPEGYYVNTMEGRVQLVAGDRTWVLYTPYGYKRGWAQSAVRRLAIPWLVRTYATRDWARSSELHGIPTRKAIVPSSADKKDKEDFFNAIVSLASEPVVLLERGADGLSGYNIEFLEAGSESWETFQQLIDHCDRDIALAVEGQNLTSDSGDNGSRALGQVHQETKLDKKRFDAKAFGEFLYSQVLRPYAELNFGDAELAPRPRWLVDPPEDLAQKATTLSSLGDGLQKLTAVSHRVDVDQVLEDFDVPLMTPEEAAAAKQERLDDAAAAAAALPPPPPPVPPAAPPQPPQATSLLTALALPNQRWQPWVDALADYARGSATRLLKEDLELLKRVLAEGKDYEGIRAALLRLYADMDPDALAELASKVLVMGHLAGMNAVMEEL